MTRALLLCLLLSGCAVHPRHRPPSYCTAGAVPAPERHDLTPEERLARHLWADPCMRSRAGYIVGSWEALPDSLRARTIHPARYILTGDPQP